MKVSILAFAGLATLFLSTPLPTQAGTLPDISGTWYSGGDRSRHCRIEQSGDSLMLRNDINGWPSLSDWQGEVGHRGYGDNCKVLNSEVAALPLLSAHTVTYEVKRVEYADGSSWP